MFSRSANTVDWQAFITALESQASMQRTAAYLFGQLEGFCVKKNYRNLRDLFSNELRINARDRMLISERDVSDFFNNRLRFNLSNEEIRLIMIEFDPSGNARDLDVDELDKDYFEHTNKDKQNIRDNFGYVDTYDQYDNYWRQYGIRGPAPNMNFKVINPYAPLDIRKPSPDPIRNFRPDVKNIASRYQNELNDINQELNQRRTGPNN